MVRRCLSGILGAGLGDERVVDMYRGVRSWTLISDLIPDIVITIIPPILTAALSAIAPSRHNISSKRTSSTIGSQKTVFSLSILRKHNKARTPPAPPPPSFSVSKSDTYSKTTKRLRRPMQTTKHKMQSYDACSESSVSQDDPSILR